MNLRVKTEERTMRTKTITVSLLFALAGCGGAGISPELRTARDTIDQARSGAAAQFEPDQVRRAERTLMRAEAAEDGSLIERDLAYVADRQARIAMAEAHVQSTRAALLEEQRMYQEELESAAIERERALRSERSQRQISERELARVRSELARVRSDLSARGRTLDARTQRLQERERDLAVREQQLTLALRDREGSRQQLRQVRSELEQVQRQLEEVRSELEERSETLDEATRRLERQERELSIRELQLQDAMRARADAEQRAQEALDALEELATVRRDGDEMIVTLSGEVLFEYDQAELRPTARRRLRAVADALKLQPGTEVVIEGHTDSRGSDAYNERLSQRRAEAVRQFLIEEGVGATQIRAVGRGEEEPVASNDTSEGRANNRRVEVHFTPVQAQRVARMREQREREQEAEQRARAVIEEQRGQEPRAER